MGNSESTQIRIDTNEFECVQTDDIDEKVVQKILDWTVDQHIVNSDSECSKSDSECSKSDSECSKNDSECSKNDSECMVYNPSKQIKTTVTSSSDFVYCILNDTTPVGYLNGNIGLENVYQTMKYYAHRVIGNMTKIDPTTQMYMYMTPTGVRITNVQNFLVQYERIYTTIRYVKIPKIGIKLKI